MQGEMSAMYKETCRTVVRARKLCPSRRAQDKVPALARCSSPGHLLGLAAETQKVSQHMNSLEGKRRKGLKIKLHEVEER